MNKVVNHLVVAAIVASAAFTACKKNKGKSEETSAFNNIEIAVVCQDLHPDNAFWMDETEITNFEYRQFVHWVRDSIIRRTLAAVEIDNAFWMDETKITNDEYRQFVHWVRDSIIRRTLVTSEIDRILSDEEE